jgi:3,4-dihydroxy 2-butanone 4-phosphate synthase / GTP cyclohydrolase II
MLLNSIDEILDDLRKGKMVIIMDDEDRENEGDLLMAASSVHPEDINFMARYGRGLICLTLTRERCQQLHLPLMINDKDILSSNFTISIEAAKGVTTGISAYDRALTIRTAVHPDTQPKDLVQPGHVFPVMAQPGGVLKRAGHTEAGCDLTRLANLEPSAVIVEILNEDGTMARRPDLEVFAKKHYLKIGTIADLIRYRMQKEKTIERVADTMVNTEFGLFRMLAYRDIVSSYVHFALVKGEINPNLAVLIHINIQNFLSDTLTLKIRDGSWTLRVAMQRVASELSGGVLIFLAYPEDPAVLINRIKCGHQLSYIDTLHTDRQSVELRTYGNVSQILIDIGIRKVRILGCQESLSGLSGFGLEIVEQVF